MKTMCATMAAWLLASLTAGGSVRDVPDGGYALVDNTPRAYMELSVDDLLPMPVTPALLSINGWRVASGGMMVIDLNDNGNKTRFGWKEPGEMIVGYGRVPVYVQHLHHLQNIIRNAGFKDYANNIHLHSI